MKKKLLNAYRNINIRELIGLQVKVLTHPDPSLEGVKGSVLDETRGMFLIRMEDKIRRVAKKGALFEFAVHGDLGVRYVTLKGDDLMFRPVDRTKKLEKKRIPNEQIKKD
jgi:ribonuclease P protein subunit POP4